MRKVSKTAGNNFDSNGFLGDIKFRCFLCLSQGLCGFGRDRKEVFLGKNQRIKDKNCNPNGLLENRFRAFGPK